MDSLYIPQAQCNIPATPAALNTTDTQATIVPCPSGICYASYRAGQVAAGCLPVNEENQDEVCTGDMSMGEVCSNTVAGGESCRRCCTDEFCNSFVTQMDGIPDSATMVAINVMLIMAAALAALM